MQAWSHSIYCSVFSIKVSIKPTSQTYGTVSRRLQTACFTAPGWSPLKETCSRPVNSFQLETRRLPSTVRSSNRALRDLAPSACTVCAPSCENQHLVLVSWCLVDPKQYRFDQFCKECLFKMNVFFSPFLCCTDYLAMQIDGAPEHLTTAGLNPRETAPLKENSPSCRDHLQNKRESGEIMLTYNTVILRVPVLLWI